MKFTWAESASTELRGIDREVAMRILLGLTKYGDSGEGDVRALSGEWLGYFRLRIGDYRVIFTVSPHEITIVFDIDQTSTSNRRVTQIRLLKIRR